MSTSVLKIKLDEVVEDRDAEMRSRMARRVNRRDEGLSIWLTWRLRLTQTVSV